LKKVSRFKQPVGMIAYLKNEHISKGGIDEIFIKVVTDYIMIIKEETEN
jgi:hypothetical protein